MPRVSTSPLLRGAATCALLTATAACGADAYLAAPNAARVAPAPRLVIIPAPSDVVVPGPDGGAFGAAFAANNSGRATTEFWDNFSADDRPGHVGCNVGFFAAGTIAAGCGDVAAGSYNNRGGYTRFFGKGAGGNEAPAFTFNGQLTYMLKLEGSYTAGNDQTVGVFYKDALGNYQLTPIAAFGARTINATFALTPSMTTGRDWGFYITNNIIQQATGCVPPDTHCSDAVGGAVSPGTPPLQQFALFLNAAGTKYLVGVEDNRLELLGTGPGHDSDNNDFLISVAPVARGGAGCSPGFWKNARDGNWALTGYARTQQFSAVFGENAFPGQTLQQVLQNGGGGLAALGRQTVAALLNAAALGNSFELAPSGVISRFNAVYPGSNAGYETLKDLFEGYTDVDGRSCPLNNGRA